MVYFEQEELIAALESVTSEATDALLPHNFEHLMPVVSYNEIPENHTMELWALSLEVMKKNVMCS